MIVFQVFELMATLMEILLGILISVKILSEDNIRWRESIIAACMITIIIWILNQYQLFSATTSLVAIGCWVISAFILYKINPVDTLCVSINYIILIYIIDFLSISIMGMILQEKQMADKIAGSFSFMRVQFLCLSKGILFGIYYKLKGYFIHKFHLRNWKICMAIIGGIGTVYYCIKNTFLEVSMNIVFIWFLLLILVLTGIFFLSQYMHLLQEKRERAMIAERNGIIVENYESMIKNYQANQIFYHDLKSQYLIIGNYLKNGEYRKAQEYMQELKLTDHFEPAGKWTGIVALDGLLAYKRKVASDLKIEVEIMSDAIYLNISDQELITLVGNALDNAIEACKEMKGENRWIRVSIRKMKEMTFFKIVNSYEKEPEVKNERFISKKQNSTLHGLGLTSMKMIVDKYDGNMNIDYEHGIFTIIFSFFY